MEGNTIEKCKLQRGGLSPISLADVHERTRKVLIDRPDLRDNIDERVVEGACAVLECYLGVPWLKKNVVTKKPDDFLVPPGSASGLRHISVGYSRIVALAECLLSMQRIDGIVDKVVRDLKTNTLQGCFSELQGTKLIGAACVPFRFRRETGTEKDKIHGSDFDVVALVAGVEVNCEMKSKCEGINPSASSLRQTLKTAKGQLPKGKPNIVFCRLPEAWMKSGKTREQVRQGVDGHFRDSARVTSVVIHWEEWTNFKNRELLIVHFRHYPSPRAIEFLPGLSQTIDSWISSGPVRWFSLHRAVCIDDEFEELQSELSCLQLAKMSMNGPGFRYDSDLDVDFSQWKFARGK